MVKGGVLKSGLLGSFPNLAASSPLFASQLRQVTVCLLGTHSLAMKSVCSFHSGTSRPRAKASSCPCTSVEYITGQARGYLLIIRLISTFGIQSFIEMQNSMTLIVFGFLYFFFLGMSIYDHSVNILFQKAVARRARLE